ncbi:sodium:solute symporter [Nitratireductor aestuarii]|uniref:histidine kinase n=1 Tax=Nitratireductor aestuarii TaxID=1735103 RepID=A0A916W3G4_9HYPH|nr:sensor histidine kinase [Nitratireductor aestuarii]GGA63050.1 sodium:solute symporter [Nitratireductor aestuarii]
MLSLDFVILTAVGYIGLLFLIAYASDAIAHRSKGSFLHSPVVYTLSIAVYCTSWTFYGAVGTAARSGLEFTAIYIGPTLVFVGWWFLLRKLILISHAQRITSVADFLSSRFGKSSQLAVLVTLIAVISVTPYIALQLKAITSSIQAVVGTGNADHLAAFDELTLALGVAVCMALFTILFGTRNVDAREQHLGVVAAIAFEAVVKLFALLAVGIFVVYGLGGGMGQIYENAAAAGFDIYEQSPLGSRWVALLVLSASAVICLPRQFQITVVENSDENFLRTAGWAFPTYLLLMSVFTAPIAFYGLTTMPAGSNPDMYVLTLPMEAGYDSLALFAFIGGFSSATSMIIVASIALSIMVSNHIVLPLALRGSRVSEEGSDRDIARLILRSRRISIAGLVALGFIYFWLTQGSDALAPIGLISFAGVAQFLPAVLAALYWRTANLKGAFSGTLVGFIVWAWTMFLPSFQASSPWVASVMQVGPWGISWLRPEALFGMSDIDPLVHAVFWSLLLNCSILALVSVFSAQGALERLQSTLFVDILRRSSSFQPHTIRGSATTSELFFVAERVLGWKRANDLFHAAGVSRAGSAAKLDVPPEFIAELEKELAGSIGSASAHILLTSVVAGDAIPLEEAMRIADETQQAIEYSHQLELTSQELRTTAQQLQDANAMLQELHRQKDDFLAHVSHEIRTPMTSIRSFSEILLSEPDLPDDQANRFISTIHNESVRLTKLIEEILDLSVLEHGEKEWVNRSINGEDVLDEAIGVCEALARKQSVTIEMGQRAGYAPLFANAGRLSQVFINIIANAMLHNEAPRPRVHVTSRLEGDRYVVEISDNGKGIPEPYRYTIFDKFVRAGRSDMEGGYVGLGLGLNISHTIVAKLEGSLELVRGHLPGACFRVSLPLDQTIAKAEAKAS